MRILIVAALYPTNSAGGAEDCAESFARWAAEYGHEVAVVTSRARDDDPFESEDGRIRLFRIAPPHILPITRVRDGAKVLKPLWHLQDHLGSGASADLARVVDVVRPDIVMIHYLQGFGYRSLELFAQRRLPIAYVVHDLGLACYRMGFFKNGRACETQCLPCQASAAFKGRLLKRADARSGVGLISPSRANLDTLSTHFDLARFEREVILNTKAYPAPRVPHVPSPTLRLFFAGKLERFKGVDRLVEAVESLVEEGRDITITVAGAGSLGEELQARYGPKRWYRQLGFVDQHVLADEMMQSDFVCVASILPENSPGVIVQALSIGVPVLATRYGGIPELVIEGENGFLTDGSRDGWQHLLNGVEANSDLRLHTRATAARAARRFDQDRIGNETVAFLQRIVDHAGQR